MNYENVNLTYLRKIGREKGVKNPCSLKKNELIKEIQAIERGEKPPFFTKRGRPLKDSTDFEIENSKFLKIKSTIKSKR